MKKLLFIFLLLFVVKVNAYENDIFKIDIPENYKLDTEENNVYKWSVDNKYISISVDSNKEKRYNINSFNDDEIKKQSEYIEKGINERLKEYKLEATVSDSKRVTENGVSSLEYKIYYPSKKLTGYNMYQIGRMYTTNKYILTIVYSNDKEINEENEYYELINSLKIFDEDVKPVKLTLNNRYFITIIAIGSLLAIISIIIDRIKKRKKK